MDGFDCSVFTQGKPMSVQSQNQNRFRGARPSGLYLMELRSRAAEKNLRRSQLAESIALPEKALPVAASGKPRRLRN